jgi:hypothetical protein
LVEELYDDTGQLAGGLVILDAASGERVQIEGVTGARAMQWGE